MKKLILHIGTHKTGSTAIQNWLYWNRDTLAAQGVLYARTDREPYPHLKKHTSLHHALMHASGDFRSEWQQIEEEFEASGCHTMILSEEGLSEMVLGWKHPVPAPHPARRSLHAGTGWEP